MPNITRLRIAVKKPFSTSQNITIRTLTSKQPYNFLRISKKPNPAPQKGWQTFPRSSPAVPAITVPEENFRSHP